MKRRLNWLNELKFRDIFALWVIIIFFFGFIYSFLSTSQSYLYNTVLEQPVRGFLDAVYFSFVSATTTGFGDLVPFGYFKLISLVELISGLLVLALVTSKLVSMKQEIIMDELYELSFSNKLRDLRGSFLLFRQRASKMIGLIEDDAFKKRNLNEVFVILSALNETLEDFKNLINRQNSRSFVKKIDDTNLELIANGMFSSLSRLDTLLIHLGNTKLDWKTGVMDSLMIEILNVFETVVNLLEKSNLKNIEKRVEELKEMFDKYKFK